MITVFIMMIFFFNDDFVNNELVISKRKVEFKPISEPRHEVGILRFLSHVNRRRDATV